jgi:hypothetical protein
VNAKRTTKNEEARVNASTPPSSNWRNYTAGINEHVMLFNASTGYNYRKNAKAKMKSAWKNYTTRHGLPERVWKSGGKRTRKLRR